MKVALFDFDGTLLRGNSWQLFFWWQVRRQPARAPWVLLALAFRLVRLVSARWLKEQVLGGLRGRSRAEVEAIGREFHGSVLVPRLRPGGIRALERCRAEGCEIALVSGAFEFLVEPFVLAQGIRFSRAVSLEFVAGVCTGRISGPELRGEAKVTVARQLWAGQDVDWAASWAYGDEAFDLPLLALVGRPVFVGLHVPPGLPPGTTVEPWRD